MGKGENEKAYIKDCNNKDFQVEIGKEVLSVDPSYFRPTEVDLLLGDASKAHRTLGWKHKVSFQQLVQEMMEADLQHVQKESLKSS